MVYICFSQQDIRIAFNPLSFSIKAFVKWLFSSYLVKQRCSDPFEFFTFEKKEILNFCDETIKIAVTIESCSHIYTLLTK